MPKSRTVISPLAERLRIAMRENGVTQKQLAARLEVTQAAVSGWTGTATPQRRTLCALAESLGVHLEWLESGRGERRVGSAAAAPGHGGELAAAGECLARAQQELRECAKLLEKEARTRARGTQKG